MTPTRPNRFLRIADRLAKVEAGSGAADQAIHEATGQAGPVLPYTTEASAAAQLLPPGFEWQDATYAGGRVYASCRRIGMDGPWHHPHHGQWARTLPLSVCGAAMRAWAKLAKG
jgi:hypothetical protein